MDIGTAFAIGAAGMQVEQTRFNVAALNLANANSTRGADGSLYQPLRVISGVQRAGAFEQILAGLGGANVAGAQLAPEVVAVQPTSDTPRLMYDPGHPAADERGFVATPAVNPTMEMLSITTALRAYQANVVAINAAKSMALKAIDIGSGA